MSPERGQRKTSFEEVISKAKEMIMRDGEHDPILIIDGGGNLAFVQISDLPGSARERLGLLQSLGQMAATDGIAHQLNQVFMVTEGWLIPPSKNENEELPPSQDPSRKEVLVISCMQVIEDKKQIKLFEIMRDQHDHVVGLEELFSEEKQEALSVEVPLLEAFVDGFKMAFRTKYN